mgnify:CR=1 FL=1
MTNVAGSYLGRMKQLRSFIKKFLSAGTPTEKKEIGESLHCLQVWTQAGVKWQKEMTGKFTTRRQRRMV